MVLRGRKARRANLVIYFIHGPDHLLAREAARAIAREHDAEGANTSWLDGREVSLDQVIAAIGTVSFFGGARVVVVTHLFARAGTDAAAEQTRSSRQNPALTPLLDAVPEQHCLILLEPSLSAPPAAVKSAADEVTIISGDPPRGAALIGWLEDAAARAGTRIERRAAQRLAETLYPQTWDRKPSNPRYDRPPDMAQLTREIEKLALAAHPDPIREEHVTALVPGGPDQRVFRFLDAMLAGDLRTASKELQRLEAAGEEPAMLLAQALGQIELATVAQAAENRDAGAVARDLGSVAASRMSSVMTAARRQPRRAPSAAEIGTLTDRRLKTGRVRRPEAALYELMLALAATSERNPGRSG